MSGHCACGCGGSTSAGRLYVHGHNRRGTSDLGRYEVRDCGYATPCWVWTGSRNARGYGRIQVGGIHTGAYRASFLAAGNTVPDGHVIDHLCRNRLCINPEHMEAVTNAENLRRGFSPSALNARKTDCLRGHELPEPNPAQPRNGRVCVTCKREREQVRPKRDRPNRVRAAA